MTRLPLCNVRFVILFALLGIVVLAASAAGDSPAGDSVAGSVESFCQNDPERVVHLFDSLDLNYPGLEKVKDHVENENFGAACNALLDYYGQSETAKRLRRDLPRRSDKRVPAADRILDGFFTCYAIEDKLPLRADGGYDWKYNGPDNDREWGWAISRHHWAGTLSSAYFATGNPVYLREWDKQVKDWIVQNPYPGRKTSGVWRGLETYMRCSGQWTNTFFACQEADELSDETRLLIISSVPDHADYARRFHAGGGNWLVMEMRGLAKLSLCWPEFKQAKKWFRYSTEVMLGDADTQVLPDGAQHELTSHYHNVTLGSLLGFAESASQAKPEIAEKLEAVFVRMANYLARTVRPSGYGLLNNDSDLDYNRGRILKYAARFKRPDWRYIATNGKEGEKPKGPASCFFPWAGQLIMRGGWAANAHWAFFDMGPAGVAHRHHDKLHLSVSSYGRDILVDSGRFTYKGDKWRRHFTGTSAHNTVVIDGARQNVGLQKAKKPLTDCFTITPEYDFGRGTHSAGYARVKGLAEHTRYVLYLRDQCWIVVDRVRTDRPRKVEVPWHYHPDCTVKLQDSQATSVDENKGNVRIVPVGDVQWTAQIVSGRTEPSIQGWYSRKYNVKAASPCVVYSADIDNDAVFAWVLIPDVNLPVVPEKLAMKSESDRVVVDVAFGDSDSVRASIPSEGTNVKITGPSR